MTGRFMTGRAAAIFAFRFAHWAAVTAMSLAWMIALVALWCGWRPK